MLEERRRIRVIEKEVRLQEKAQKAALREEALIARQAEKQLQNDSYRIIQKG